MWFDISLFVLHGKWSSNTLILFSMYHISFQLCFFQNRNVYDDLILKIYMLEDINYHYRRNHGVFHTSLKHETEIDL